ncbi:autotransporter outer membrane beta-barrel domain-containing protein [Sutterella sp.]|uniref:autotransporter outer membrane beta-barrel domain-containing protein n=1 Tax=Sutterella sp. TaxID=1981025 RepID=UPI0026DF056B|nr:autotransporter outer membrane beta-barrel domain-containing protein [Sutterella sp.]MDO5532369.1 autotransporter outer membrane beta-barrel domain-containing protein [Sutterella sp.]
MTTGDAGTESITVEASSTGGAAYGIRARKSADATDSGSTDASGEESTIMLLASAEDEISTADETGETTASTSDTVTADTGWLTITATAGGESPAVAVHAGDGYTVDLDASSGATVAADDIAIIATGTGQASLEASETTGSTVTGGIAVAAVGSGAAATVDTGDGATVTGDIYAADGGSVDVTLYEGSTFTGLTDNWSQTDETLYTTYTAEDRDDAVAVIAAATDENISGTESGSISLSLGSGSTWNVTGDSWLDSLDVRSAVVDISYATIPSASNYHRVTTNTLSGSDGTFTISIDLANESADNVATDQLVIIDGSTETATHKVAIELVGEEPASDKLHSANWLISQMNESPSSSLAFETTGDYRTSSTTVAYDGSTDSWALKFLPADEVEMIETTDWTTKTNTNEVSAASESADASGTTETEAAEATTISGEAGNWYLVRMTGSNAPDTPETDTVKNVGTSQAQYLAWRGDLSDLRQRLGEVRYGAQDGGWVKIIYERERASGLAGQGYKAKTYGIHVGADGFVKNTENGSWLAGGSLRFARVDQKHLAEAGNGEGELDQYSAKLYATLTSRSGAYADIVLSGGYYDQDLEGVSNQGHLAKADYSTYGAGISVEAGHMLSFGEDVDDRQWYNHWFLEPQLQLAYYWLKGKDFNTTTGMSVSQDDVHFLTGRAGFVLGKKWNYGGEDDLDKRFLQVALKGGLIHEFLGEQDVTLNDSYKFQADMGGTTYYYGFTGDWEFARSQKFYLTIEQERGSDYRKDLGVRFGYRNAF